MLNKLCQILLICIFIIGIAYLSQVQKMIVVRDDNWNMIVFTQQWPITSCIEHLNQKKNSSCNLFLNVTTWTIHGVWPTQSGTKGPDFCNKTWHFNLAKLQKVEPLLEKYWCNIFADTSTPSLWKHEWVKHGTCAVELSDMDTELKYFSQGLKWAKKYDILTILGNWKIFPDDENSYRLDDIFGVIKYYTGITPIIDCVYNSKEKEHQLSQIKLCFNRKLKLVDCDHFKGSDYWKIPGNCPPKGIIYPSSVQTPDGITYRYIPDQ